MLRGMTDLKLGMLLWSQTGTWPEMLDAARRIDRLGYEHLWTWDHLYAIYGDPYQPIFEGWSLLNAWAMATERVRLGLLVGANTFRNPGLFARHAVTLDHVSGGRAILGVGGAWFDLEHQAHGLEFGSGYGQRLDWLDEAVAAMHALLRGRAVTSEPGGRYAFDDLRLIPGPLQDRLPIMIGGSGEKKTLRTIARYADQWNAFGTADVLAHKDGVLRRHCAEVGRDEREIERTVGCKVVIRDSAAEARRVWAAQMAHNRTPEDEWDGPDVAWIGTPEEVAAEIRSRAEVGFRSVIVEMPAPYDVETIERLIGEVKPLVERG
jgi:alkanesulfonate monooxygenase SsuD/methylene tetrahydromethanopterin reductase-like flavin-dependent oxidoreductase (luciferase family)